MFEIIALSVLCLLAGLVLGYGIAQKHQERRDAAPVPVDLGYDPLNPINRRGEDCIEVEGIKLWRIC